ncbi:uncharacterized protein LOC111350529 [Spodoptera litura]|uniref:Uncharacterized protein LOC111350529 n=1 Tax=Spodoptera litura TaxID=69820 RepID=A0A9J7DW07_SPOLT|nr:uncharacterized protein LOC111350529 [Spodoptera litura]
MRYFYLTVLIFFLGAIQASKYLNLNEIRSMLENSRNAGAKEKIQGQGSMKRIQDTMNEDGNDRKLARNKANVLKKVQFHKVDKNPDRDLFSPKLPESIDKKIGREYFLMDPVLNELRRRGRLTDFRKKGSDESDSSSLGLPDWKQEWDELWLQKKFEALNSSIIRGDVVNMAAARPWGTQCGDPHQHDAPWGTCMLAAECEPEYRIYRGDIHCGNTMYICCAILATKYDMYNGLDISFEDSEFGTDTAELNRQHDAPDKNNGKKDKDKNKRKKEREKRKNKILKNIRKIIKEIRKILNNAYRNGTNERKKKTKQLKKFIESMKKQYKKDRQSVVQVHDFELIKIDDELKAKLDQIQSVNENFMSNDTFRNIIINGSLSKRKLKRLLRSHPELAKYMNMKLKRRNTLKHKRRSGIDLTAGLDPGDRASRSLQLKPKKLDYDVEYGMLYY